MKRRRPTEETFDAVDVLFARRDLKAAGGSALAAEVVAELRSLDRPLTTSELECLELAECGQRPRTLTGGQNDVPVSQGYSVPQRS